MKNIMITIALVAFLAACASGPDPVKCRTVFKWDESQWTAAEKAEFDSLVPKLAGPGGQPNTMNATEQARYGQLVNKARVGTQVCS